MSRLATIIICLIISVILGFFLLWPQYQKFSNARWSVKEKEDERKNQEGYFTHIESTSKELEGYQEQISKILSAIPFGSDVPEILNFLYNASNENGMNLEKINSFSAGQPQKTSSTSSGKEEPVASRTEEIIIDFNVSGGYTDLKNFISTLERNARIIEIESISLRRNTAKQEATTSFLFNLKIKAYYY
jgi:Tfp pilus assembly protein PilO